VALLAYLVLFVDLLHAPLALRLCDYLSGILDNDLVRFKCSHSTHAKAPILGVQNLYAIIITVAFGTSPEFCKGPVVAQFCRKWTVRVITLVCHDAIVASFTTTIFRITIALGGILLLTLPQGGCLADKSVCKGQC
jgi:hypothetical protein